MEVITDRETLALDLRTYGEDRLAQQVMSIDDDQLARIQKLAGSYLAAHSLIAKALTLAAIEVLEGRARQPRWKRRKLKGIYPERDAKTIGPRGEPVDRREVERAIADALSSWGYQRARGDRRVFVKPLGEEVTGQVGFFTDRLRSGELDVTPVAEVRHERIHELIDRLKGRRGSRTEPTATIILGYLLPENNPALVWRFDRQTPANEIAQSLAEYVVRFGEPWMRKRVSIERIIEDARADRKVNPERLPAALLIAGRADEARAALEALLDEARDRTDDAAQNFRRFAERFRSELLAPTPRPTPTTGEG